MEVNRALLTNADIDVLATVIAKLLKGLLVADSAQNGDREDRDDTNDERPTPEILTVDEASQIARLTPNYVYRLVAKKRLQSVKVGRLVRIKREDLDAWIEARRRPDTEELLAFHDPRGPRGPRGGGERSR